MAQLVTRIDDDLARAVDELVSEGEVASRSEAVRVGLRQLIESRRRAKIGRAIVDGYERIPETADEVRRSDDLTRQLVDDEPW